MSTSKLSSLSILVALVLVACADTSRDERSMCLTQEHLAAYDLAYGWSEESSDTDDLDASGLREVQSADAASCALAGTRAALRKKRGGGRHGGGRHGGGHHGGGRHGGGHHGGGRHGGGHHGGGHHGGGHHGGGGSCGSDTNSECRDDGAFAGRFAAAAYCELSITLDGLEAEEVQSPGPESQCSQSYEASCLRAFDEVARHFENVSGDPGANCRPFTRGEFGEAYQVARYNACLFSLADASDAP